jgi:hypothetical protein
MLKFTQLYATGWGLIVILMACVPSQQSFEPFQLEWHMACKVAAWSIPSSDKRLMPRSDFAGRNNQLGTCTAQHVEGVNWFVRGTYLTQQMKNDGIATAKFEALMYAKTDFKDLAVQRYGTQYLLCSMAIDGIDVSHMPLLNMCADARYLEAYKLKYHL